VTRKRALLCACAMAVATFVLGAACTFPDVSFAPPGGTGTEAGSPDGAVADGGLGSDFDATVLVDGSDPDALIVRDAGAKIDAAGCAPAACDCDGDGFNDTLKAGCEGGLNDCDDHDERVRPNQGYLIATPESPVFGDWNCSMAVDKLYPDGFSCSSLQGGKACNDAVGMEDQPACGGFGTLLKCKTEPVPPLNLTTRCVVGTRTPMTQQACK
jgi:hypothetical protein